MSGRLGIFQPEIKNVVKTIGLLLFLLLPAALIAQNSESAIYGDGTVWAGGEASFYNPDWGCHSNLVFNCKSDLSGATALFDVNLAPRWGSEGEARWLRWQGPGNERESNYFLGPRYKLYRINRFSLWAKFMVGGGWITTPNYPEAGSLKGSYFVYSPGGTLGYRLSSHLSLRADYEFEFWPSFAAPSTTSSSGTQVSHDSGLTPNGVSVGVMYRFLGQ
jgi:hypothetical protein